MRLSIFIYLLLTLICSSCSGHDWEMPDEPPFDEPQAPGTDDGDIPDFDGTIHEYQGQRADDAGNDVAGDDKDHYWEANKFTNTVTVTYSGQTASVTTSNDDILYVTEGAHVVIDMLTNAVSGTEIVIAGKSDDGSLKIYGSNKYKLTLAGVELTSSRGPAINSQCKKRIYVHLADGKTNRLTDSSKYTDDVWYAEGSDADSEDRKGAFFSEGNLIFSGTGVLEVAGKKKHAIASDGYMYTRPGVTIAVTEAAKNAIHIKGDSGDNMGILITGGLIYTNTASDAGKGLKTDMNVEIRGGKLDLNTSGNAIYDADENDTSSAAGIKTDGNIVISGGNISIKSTGTGGKGLNSDGSIAIDGGETTIITTGGKYYYSSSMTSSPKGVKADGDINITDGKLNISVTGVSDGSEGLESKSVLTVDGGEIYVHAYDDAINAASGIEVNDGRIYAYSSNNDAIDSNGYMHFNGGLTIAAGSSTPEESFDCDISSKFVVNGGTLIGTAGSYMSVPSSASSQRVVIYGGLQASKGDKISILDNTGKAVMICTVPRTLSKMALFFSSPDLSSGSTYTISRGGTVSDFTESWNGWYDGGKWTGGSSLGTFTCTNVVTTAGTAGGNGPGGRP